MMGANTTSESLWLTVFYLLMVCLLFSPRCKVKRVGTWSVLPPAYSYYLRWVNAEWIYKFQSLCTYFFLILMTTPRGRYCFFSYYKWGTETALWLSAFFQGTPIGSAQLSPFVPCWHLLWPQGGNPAFPCITLTQLRVWPSLIQCRTGCVDVERTCGTENDSEILQSQDLTWHLFLCPLLPPSQVTS